MPGFFWKNSFGSELSGPQGVVKERLPVEPENNVYKPRSSAVIVWVGGPKLVCFMCVGFCLLLKQRYDMLRFF